MSLNLKQDILNAVAESERLNTANKCKHKWVFQETKKKTSISCNNGYYTAHFHRVDVYYCENCCEIKELEKKASIDLPFGGIHRVDDFAPVWY